MNRKVSIIVPVYNSHTTLPKCLDSLLAQTYQDLEIICVNDKSTDNSFDIIREYQKKDKRVQLIEHKENKNAGGARNSGIKAAKGTYVCFVDNDDWMTPDAIDVLVKESDDFYVDIVVPQWCMCYSDGRSENQENLLIGSTKEKNCEYALKYGWRMLGNLIRKDIFYTYNIFYPENSFFEDNAISICLLYCAKNIKVIDKVLYHYYVSQGSSSRSVSVKKIEDRIRTTDMYLNNMMRLGVVNDDNKSLVEYYYLSLTLNTFYFLPFLKITKSVPFLSGISKKTKCLLPNIYMEQIRPEGPGILKHPILPYLRIKIALVLKSRLPKCLLSIIMYLKGKK